MLNKINILGVIPARFDASRLPGKLLMKIGDQSVLQMVHHQVVKSEVLDKVIIATDDERIFQHAVEIGADVMMTNPNHKNGTNRCIEVLNSLNAHFDYMVNIQGDEPFIDALEIDSLIQLMIQNVADIGTLAYPLANMEDFVNPNIVKVVRSQSKNAMYFSRSPIPFHSKSKGGNVNVKALQHIGLYAFHRDIIEKISNMEYSELEQLESLEQLKWLDNNCKIVVGDALNAHIGIDTMEDLDKARALHQ